MEMRCWQKKRKKDYEDVLETALTSSELLSELLLSDSTFFEAAAGFAGSSSELLSSLLSELDSCLADCAAVFGLAVT
jgi:hypothetical protein